MLDLLFVALIVGSTGAMALGLFLVVRQLFVDPSQLPWIVWPAFVLIALLLLGRWAKYKPGTPPPVRESVRGRIHAAASATTSSPFAKSATSPALVLLVGAHLLHLCTGAGAHLLVHDGRLGAVGHTFAVSCGRTRRRDR